jgi:hypothetical protein
MTIKTWRVLAASTAILVAGLTAGTLAYFGYLGRGSQGAPTTDFRYVPSGVDVVASANVRLLMDSGLGRQLRKMAAEETPAGRGEFRDRTGIDIETDVDRVLACLVPVADPSTASPAGLMLAWGRFDPLRIERLVREGNGTVEDYRGKRILIPSPPPRRPRQPDSSAPQTPQPPELPEPTPRPPQIAIAFINPGLAAVGSPALVRATIDLERSGANLTADKEMMALIRDVEGGDVWAVGRLGRLREQVKAPPELMGKLPPLRFFSATGMVDGGVSGRVQAEAADEASASELRDVVRGFVALARLQVGSRPEFQPLLKSLELGGTGKIVSLSFSVPPEALEGFAGMMDRRRPGSPGPRR